MSLFSAIIYFTLPPLCTRYAGSSFALAELAPLQALLAIAIVYGLIELAQYGMKQMRMRPFILEIRRQMPAYYMSLPVPQQKEFEKRVAQFILQKTFVPRGDRFEVTLPMKVRVAASAVQLTFGLGQVYFSHFKTILIYPDRYYSTIFKRYHCGEVNTRGYIVLSWRDFESGYDNYTDGFNLGLHEMAHALHLENRIRNNEYDFLDREHLQAWHDLASSEMLKQQSEQNGFLRRQAHDDEHEFFAVCVESFFERPHDFRLSNPKVYDSLSQLLQQDPARGIYQL
ncbi:Mlc titration factor MtfA (ptsG expression regulator) [Pontibacter aydingkolensis]|uniref:Zinc-dependent peptidase n=1 Tax=Pontibacter aydingkolensis TaxID=1911536 RepID=A0ABS7CYE4_9BACT|nr:zinc-dependent peptidase [Pontibacter aydingkolensis]MBW7468859.1 zinc-dependent peptidase [Pontibacter aydingkolensis]